jgi:chromosome segregation ATPase
MAKCRELNAELVANAAKVQSVLQGSKEEDGTTAQLQKELEEAWKLVDQARANEARLKEQIEDLKEEINGLNAMIEDNAAQAEAKSEDMQELLAQRKALEVERDNQMELVARLRADVAEMTREQQQLLANKRTSDARAADLEEQLTARKNEAEREERRKGHLERELVMRKQEVEARQAEIDAQQDEIRLVQAEVEELQTLMESRNAELDRLSSELDEANMRNRKLEKQVEDSMMANQNAFEDNSRLQAELRASEDNVAQLRGEGGKLQKLFETMQRKLRSSEETRAELTTQRDTLRGEIHSLERELEAAKRSSDNDRKRMEEMARTRELMTKKMMQAGRETEMQEALVRMHESTKKTLEAEIAGFRDDNEQQRKQIAQLERDRDRNINEAATAQSKSLQALEDAKANEREIIDLKKRLADMDTKLRQQQSLYEQVRGDRNIYSKNLIEAQDEISEMKRKLKILNHQIDQLKEEITTKENHLQREHQSYELLEGQKIKLKSELDKYKAAAQRHERDIATQQVEQDKLRKLVTDADVECARQKTELEKVVRERDMLGTQLIRRNDELALVYEKLRIQQATLSRGEQQYRERLEDVRLLRMEIKRLRREKTVMTKSTSDVDDLRRELFQAQRECVNGEWGGEKRGRLKKMFMWKRSRLSLCR